MTNSTNNSFAYTSSTLLNAYKKKRNELVPLLKEKKEEDFLKKVHLALLSIDLCVQIFNDANRSFPLINKEILEQAKENIPLVKNKTASLKKLKKGLHSLNPDNNLILNQKLHYSIELSDSTSKEIPAEIASNILKENAFLFTHILHTLYENQAQEEVFDAMTAHIKYMLGLCVIEPISPSKDIYQEILKEREKYQFINEIETFILNAHHYCLTILLFVKHWTGQREFSLADAEKSLNDKINAILKQRQSNPS